MSQYPIAAKTQAAGVSAAVSGAALYLLQAYVFKGAVPAGVESLIYAAVPGLVAFAAAYMAPHQDRTQAPAVAYVAGGKAFHPDDVVVVRNLPLPGQPDVPVTPPA